MNDMTDESKFLCYLDIRGFKNRITEDGFRRCYESIIKNVIEPFDYTDKVYLESVHKLRFTYFVIPRLDRGIQSFQWVLDPPVKPEDDKL